MSHPPEFFWQDPALVAASLVGIPTPRPLSEMSELPTAEPVRLTLEQIYEGHITAERR